MPLMHCPHCGAENFTMEGWEDLDRCSSCGKPLGEPVRRRFDPRDFARRAEGGRGPRQVGEAGTAEKRGCV